jgi:hypothetical protein
VATADPFQARGLKRSTVNVANAVKPTAKTNLSVIDGGRETRKIKKIYHVKQILVWFL